MNIRIQVLIVAVALLCMFYVINKIRNKGIELKYSLIWLALGVGILLFTCFPQLTNGWHICWESVSQSTCCFLQDLFMLPIIFSLSVSVSSCPIR